MGLFGFGKNENVVDLAEKYRQQKEDEKNAEANGESVSKENNEFADGDTAEERRRKLAKRLLDLTKRIEDLSSKMYGLQQRVEVLERKSVVRTE